MACVAEDYLPLHLGCQLDILLFCTFCSLPGLCSSLVGTWSRGVNCAGQEVYGLAYNGKNSSCVVFPLTRHLGPVPRDGHRSCATSFALTLVICRAEGYSFASGLLATVGLRSCKSSVLCTITHVPCVGLMSTCLHN